MGVFVALLLLFAHSFFIRSRFNFVIYSSPPTPLVSIFFGLTQPPRLLVSKATLFAMLLLSLVELLSYTKPHVMRANIGVLGQEEGTIVVFQVCPSPSLHRQVLTTICSAAKN